MAAAGHDAHSITATQSALFTNWSAGNYNLIAGTPAIGAGVSAFAGTTAPNIDLNGNPRPGPSGYSIGAYEVPGVHGTTSTGTSTTGTGSGSSTTGTGGSSSTTGTATATAGTSGIVSSGGGGGGGGCGHGAELGILGAVLAPAAACRRRGSTCR
jgi:hypothetical protein